jgi:micrococcal nuclease
MVPKMMIPAIPQIIAVFSIIAVLQIIALSQIIAVSASPYEASGVVLKVVDGGTFEVQGLGRVRLADVDSPEMGTIEGVHAKEYALENLLGAQVFLDLDDNMRKKSSPAIACVAYLAYRNGTPNLGKNFNKMMVQSGYASLRDDTKNEFDPSHW